MTSELYEGRRIRQTGTLTAAGQAVTHTNVNGYPTQLVEIYGTYAGLGVVFEFSDENVISGTINWYPAVAKTTGGFLINGAGGTVTNPSNNSLNSWWVATDGARQFRVRCTAITSGTASVVISPLAATASRWSSVSLQDISSAGNFPVSIVSQTIFVQTDEERIGGAAYTLGQKAMANSAPVVLASDQSAVRVASTPPNGLATGTLFAVPITITNNQSTGTGTNFIQRIAVNSLTYIAYEDLNLKNVNFQDANGTIQPSWLESGETSNSTSTVYWVKVLNGIPANASATIYLCFYATGQNVKNTTDTGTEPTWPGGSYGQYDNGATFWLDYDNFSGTTLSASWTTIESHSGANSNPTITVNNGVTFSGTTANGNDLTQAIIHRSTSAVGSVFELVVSSMTSSGGAGAQSNFIGPMASTTTPTTTGGVATFSGYEAIEQKGSGTTFADALTLKTGDAGVTGGDSGFLSANNSTIGIGWIATGTQTLYFNGTSSNTTTDSGATFGSSGRSAINFTVTSGAGGANMTAVVTVFRARQNPPSNVMPTVSFGAIISGSNMSVAAQQNGPWSTSPSYQIGTGTAIKYIASVLNTFSTLALASNAATVTVTSSDAYVQSIAITFTSSSSSGWIGVQDGSTNDLVHQLTWNVSSVPTVVTWNVPVKLTGGIKIINNNTGGGTANVWISYWQ